MVHGRGGLGRVFLAMLTAVAHHALVHLGHGQSDRFLARHAQECSEGCGIVLLGLISV